MKYESIDLEKLEISKRNIPQKNPMAHQMEAFEALSETFSFPMSGYKAGLLVLPTGAGKTFTAVNWISQNILSRGCKVIWLAQSSYLLDQAYDSFNENAVHIPPSRSTINIRVVSSKTDHSNPSEIEITDDILIMTTQTAIARFNDSSLGIDGNQVETAFQKYLRCYRDKGIFIVLDEAHHAPAYGCRNLLLGVKERIPDMYLLGLTATPTHSDKKISGWLYRIFDKRILYEAKVSQLISDNILALPEYLQKSTGKELEVDDQLYNRLVRDHKDLPEEIVEKLASDSARNDYITREYLENRDKYGKTLIFADRWFQCEYILTNLLEKGIRAEAVYSKVLSSDNRETRGNRSIDENNKIIDDFKKGVYDVLINVRMMTEGVDVPDVETVFITRQTTSSILMTQMIGRALRGRKAGGGKKKDKANIVLFVDNWKRIINWVNPKDGSTEDSGTIVRGSYPMDYISILLIRKLAKDMIGPGTTNTSYTSYIPVGWYLAEYTVSNVENEEMQTFREYVMVFDVMKNKFEKFINEIKNRIPPQFADEKIMDSDISSWLSTTIDDYFINEEDDFGGQLESDLIKIIKHLAQSGVEPVYHAFEERNHYDLRDLVLESNELGAKAKNQHLINIYNKNGSLWQTFYKTYIRFKTAYDREENQYIMSLNNDKTDEPIVKEDQHQPDELDYDSLREYILKRDGYKCVCCGKERGRGVKLEIDHIIPYIQGGKTMPSNLQTLCRECNRIKGTNGIDFRNNYSSPLFKPKELVLYEKRSIEKSEHTLIRCINFFYHCKAVSNVESHSRKNGTYYNHWMIELHEGNNPEWINKHETEILKYIQKDLERPQVKRITIKSGIILVGL